MPMISGVCASKLTWPGGLSLPPGREAWRIARYPLSARKDPTSAPTPNTLEHTAATLLRVARCGDPPALMFGRFATFAAEPPGYLRSSFFGSPCGLSDARQAPKGSRAWVLVTTVPALPLNNCSPKLLSVVHTPYVL